MTHAMNVIAMVFDGPVLQALGEAAERHLWPVVRPTTARDALGEVLRRRPLAVVAQLSPPPDQDMGLKVVNLIRKRHAIPLVAVSARHSPKLETEARLAGVTTYLPDLASSDELLQTVQSLLLHARDAPSVGDEARLDDTGRPLSSTSAGDTTHATLDDGDDNDDNERNQRRRAFTLRNR